MKDTKYKRNWLCKREIDRGPNDKYLTRYVVFRCKWFSIYIHQFHASDFPVPHDHPWTWMALPLRTGYIEHFLDGTSVERKPFRPVIRGAREFHWIELKPGSAGKTWTLFITGKVKRDWGFFTKKGWVPNAKYTESLNKPVKPKIKKETKASRIIL